MSAKTQTDYWKSRLFKQTFTSKSGAKKEVSTYSCKMQHKGHRETFNTGEPNKQKAAEKARDIYMCLRAVGWEETKLKYKQPTEEKPEAIATVGDVLRVAREVSTISERTFTQYAIALRRLANDIAKIPDTREKYSYRISQKEKDEGITQSGNQRWVAQVDAVSLTKLTPSALLAWEKKQGDKNKDNPAQQRRDKDNAASTLRRARSLFGKKLITSLKEQLTLPEVLPFDDDRFKWKPSTKRYVQSIDPKELVGVASSELAKDEPESYKALLLCIFCGLRRAEADCLTWEQIDFSNQLLHIKETPHFKPKTLESTRTIHLSEKLIVELKKLKKLDPLSQKTNQHFVLRGGKAKPNSKHPYYRADLKPWKTWSKLARWLKEKGIESSKPIHELRKMSGSLINESFGIEAARNHLGHSDVSTTSKSYLGTQKAVIDL
ncbi:tyrosine-type recombinase/integrase [Coraliomargarita sp. SDUM461003]|uniref:Tyrosine-type recombinase/integrase n=1 Tax=Thalassobacterium maritimum TaxID=3041265 RepID=A0ABU1AVJ3_9BACT|nr:tyrosine-type recombinase/integrase [Coraliomargarita sp. SDUM461003]MDQ8208168.1 tyrosine-type recombinase/integrase [Coraliomargarita sp. SDUM461003]